LGGWRQNGKAMVNARPPGHALKKGACASIVHLLLRPSDESRVNIVIRPRCG
jgi:hypothetical protein